jgi:hypothetical protein
MAGVSGKSAGRALRLIQGVLAGVHPDRYAVAMPDNHRPLRVPRDLWDSYAAVAGAAGRTADLKVFIDWQNEHPDSELADDVDSPLDLLTTVRIELPRWNRFMTTVGSGACSARLRGYISWRIEHPEEPLPGSQVPGRRPALV